MADLQIREDLVDEIKQLIVEGEFNSRWTLIETYHAVGKAIASVNVNRSDLLQGLAPKVGKSVRTLLYAVKFYEMYPDLQNLPEGKNISMNKIITKYLTEPKNKECLHENVITISFDKCEDCDKKVEGGDNK